MALNSRCARSGLVAVLACLALAPGARGEEPTRYVLAEGQSCFTYSMEHTMHSWSGTSKTAKGEIDIQPQDASAAVNITIPVLSFDSGNANRDSHMAETVESYIYSDVTFRSTEAHLDSTTVTPEGATCKVWTVKGVLNLHGVDHGLECPVQVVIADGRLRAHGSFAVKLTDFGLELPSLLGMKVKDEIDMVFDAVGTVVAAQASAPRAATP